MTFIDTHTHFYDEAFSEDAAQAIARGQAVGVTKFLQPDVDSREREQMFALVDQYPGVLYPMIGLYPGSVEKNWQEELQTMEKWLTRSDLVAVGEIGLDYHYGAEFAQEQKEAFRVQLEMAARMDLPVNIHLREATEDFIKILEECKHLGLRGNLHAYSGSYETFCRVQRLGDWYVGIGGVVTFKKATLAEVVKKIPLDRIVLETDSPYLTPTPYRGQRNESAYISIIAAKVAELKQVSVEEVAEVTTHTAEKLFSLK